MRCSQLRANMLGISAMTGKNIRSTDNYKSAFLGRLFCLALQSFLHNFGSPQFVLVSPNYIQSVQRSIGVPIELSVLLQDKRIHLPSSRNYVFRHKKDSCTRLEENPEYIGCVFTPLALQNRSKLETIFCQLFTQINGGSRIWFRHVLC